MDIFRVHEDDRAIVWSLPRPDAATCVISFSAWTSTPPGDRFGEPYLARRGHAAVFVCAKCNDWWQGGSMEGVLAAVDAAAGSHRRVSYGSSMGGFAALAFAGRLGCVRAVAISPQAAIHRGIVPWETRWSEEARDAGMGLGNAGQWLSPGVEAHIVYDPTFRLDRRHVELIASGAEASGQTIHRHRFAWSGHPSGAVLRDAQVLEPLINALIDATDAGGLKDRYRQGRWRSAACAVAVLTNHDLLRRHPAMAARLGDRFRKSVRWNGKLGFLLARALDAAGRQDDALEALNAAPPINDRNQAEIEKMRARLDSRSRPVS